MVLNPKENLIPFLLKRNQEQSAIFLEQNTLRKNYKDAHPTEICGLLCMDGRLNLSIMTKIPPGIIQTHRNIGGKFTLGWPFFGLLLRKWVDRAKSTGKDCLIFATYHFSKGDKHRGCAGFGYDTQKAKEDTQKLIEEMKEVFGNKTVYPVLMGIETDDESLVIHGSNEEIFHVGQDFFSEKELFSKLQNLFPNMKENVVRDFLPLVVGNQNHTQEIKNSERLIFEAQHKEQILAIGRDFDWLHLMNKALIIGPYSFDLANPIELASKLLLSNIHSGRIPAEEGILLFTSSVYPSKESSEYGHAVFKSKAFANFALEVIDSRVPELKEFLIPEVLTGVVNYNTLEFTRIDFKV